MGEYAVQLYRWDSGDWYALVVERQLVYEGHSIPDHIWLEVLERMGAGTEEIEVPWTEDGPDRFMDIEGE